jgi:hypothetical protein
MRPEEQDARDEAWRAVFADVLDEYRAVTGEAPARQQQVTAADPAETSQWTMAGYADGPTLSEVVGVLGPLPPPVVAALAVGLAEALAEIHAVGVVRGDLQPPNVLLADDGPGLRVAGFGIAGGPDGGAVAEAGWAFDDPGYLAPEQVLGLPSGPAADVFSLGAVLFYAAGGVLPFGGDEPSVVMFRVVHEEPALDAVPMVLRGLVKACLSKDPAQRPALQTIVGRALGVLSDAATATAVGGPSQEALFADTELPEGVFPDTVLPEAVPPETALPETALPEAVPPETGPPRTAPPKTGFRENVPPQGDEFPSEWFAPRSFPADVYQQAPTSGSVFAEATQTMAMPAVDPEPTMVISLQPVAPAAPPRQPRRPRSASRRRGRSRSTTAAVLGTIVVIGVAAAFLVRSVAHSNTSVAAHPPPSASLPHAPLPGTYLAGPGCTASAWTSTTASVAGNPGLVPAAGGGATACGGMAIAFVKSGTTAPGAFSYTWTFRLGSSVRCTLSVYVANADPSSGIAQYQLHIPPSRNATGVTAMFKINQGKAKGQWVAAPALNDISLPDGVVQLTLTNAGSFTGDRFHVTASAVRAACSQVP